MKITEAESAVMKALWEASPASADDIILRLSETENWKDGTVKTLLNRLLTKGALTAKRDGRRFLYEPNISKDDFLFSESKNLLDRFFKGDLAPFVAHFSKRTKLSKSEIKELKAIIERLSDGK